MIWDRKEKDPYRWRRRFALFPKTVGDNRVWLEVYAYRRLTLEEAPQRPTELIILGSEGWEEWTLKSGYTVWKKIEWIYGTSQHVTWHNPTVKHREPIRPPETIPEATWMA